jgi:hypothetical protein
MVGGGYLGVKNGPLSQARFNAIIYIAHDAESNHTFILEEYHNIREIDHKTGVVRPLVGYMSNIRNFLTIAVIPTKFRTASRLLVASAESSIWTISVDGKLALLCGHESESGYADGTGVETRFKYPIGLAIDSVGRVIVADNGNYAVRRITIADSANDTVNGSTTVTVTTIIRTSEIWDANCIRAPRDICVDQNDNIFVADIGRASIRRIDGVSGTDTIYADNTRRYPGGANGICRPPSGVAFEPRNDLLFFTEGNKVRVVDSNGIVMIVQAFMIDSGEILRGLDIERYDIIELTNVLRSNAFFCRSPPGLVAIVASFLPRISLLVFDSRRLMRLQVSF